MSFFLVGIGGLLGAISRYLLSDWLNKKWQKNFPLATFLINVFGSFLLGCLTGFHLANKSFSFSSIQLLLGIGFLGAFTTFSTFIYETVVLTEKKKRQAFFYSFLSITVGLGFCWLGFSFFL